MGWMRYRVVKDLLESNHYQNMKTHTDSLGNKWTVLIENKADYDTYMFLLDGENGPYFAEEWLANSGYVTAYINEKWYWAKRG